MSAKKDDQDTVKAYDGASSQVPAKPPPDNPSGRFNEFDPDREYKSREMAEKRLKAIRKTREMPTSEEESQPTNPEHTTSHCDSD